MTLVCSFIWFIYFESQTKIVIFFDKMNDYQFEIILIIVFIIDYSLQL